MRIERKDTNNVNAYRTRIDMGKNYKKVELSAMSNKQ